VFYKKGWYNESKTQLEMAVSMDPSNLKYKDALGRLNVFMSGGLSKKAAGGYYDDKQYRKADEQINPNKDQNDQSRQNYGYEDRQMGGGCGPESCCMQLICADCCCECMGGDLIACC
jgi:molecular chaperone DnaJ